MFSKFTDLIVGEDDEEAAEQGYKPFVPKDERDL